MFKKKIVFYLSCLSLFLVSALLFEIRFAILFISIFTIVTSLIIAIIKIGIPDFKIIYKSIKNDVIEFFKLNIKDKK